MFRTLRQVYVESLKPKDILFNTYLARPLAAPIVLLCARCGIAPNHITLLSALPALVGALCFVFLPGAYGLWMGILGFELAYILDCVDGQLARYTGQVTKGGGLLDFAMDGLKALLMAGALGVRVQAESHWTPMSVYLGMGTVTILAFALICTYLMRGQTLGEPEENRTNTALVTWFMAPFKWVAHYPSSLPVFALFLPLESFLWAYGGVHVLYAGRSILVLTAQFGRVAPDMRAAEEDDVR